MTLSEQIRQLQVHTIERESITLEVLVRSDVLHVLDAYTRRTIWQDVANLFARLRGAA